MADEPRESRRLFSAASSTAMFAGLIGGYGLFGYLAGRFLYPAKSREMAWMYVAQTVDLKVGDTLLYEAPSGETINVTLQADTGSGEEFIALSSTCPHLGCQVHWESRDNRYFCPCHNGIFDPSGKGIGGPPGDAGQSLLRYRVKIDRGLLFMEVPVTSIADGRRGRVIDKIEGIQGPGHDPCLTSLRPRKSCEPCDKRNA